MHMPFSVILLAKLAFVSLCHDSLTCVLVELHDLSWLPWRNSSNKVHYVNYKCCNKKKFAC